MASLNFSLPKPMRDWVETQVRGGRYGNVSEYIRDLIRRDQERLAQDRLEALLLEGIESGPAAAMHRKDWQVLRDKVAGRVPKSRKRRALAP